MFHVKQVRARSPRPSAVGPAGHSPARALSSRRCRTWRSSATSAAGVTPAIRAAAPSVAGRDALQLLAHLVRKAADRGVIEIARQASASSRRKARDVGVLALEIAGISAVDLELLGDLRRQAAELRPDAAQTREVDLGIGQQIGGRARARPSGVDRDAVRAQRCGRQRQTSRQRRAPASSACDLGREGAGARRADTAQRQPRGVRRWSALSARSTAGTRRAR